MKKKLSIITAILLCLVLVLTLLVACEKDKDDGIKAWEKNEWVASDSPLYRDYYHIFVYSFCDSNGDGIGDLNGVKSKLDYIAGLGFNGIWLSPIHPSSTEHCYDVEDYYGVNSKFGTLSDFDDLVAAAHEKGISVMMDLVINHSSNKHEWFKDAKNRGASSPYFDYYTFRNESRTLYDTFGTEMSMPKLNLNNTNLRAELEQICKYWLQTHHVDAFRLDAAYHFFSNPTKNIEFMQWFMGVAKKYNPDVYMVGEVWQNETMVYSHYAEDSVQSFFNFYFSSAPGNNKLMIAVNPGRSNRASTVENLLKNNEAKTAKGIDALFASNHDTSRIANQVSYLDRAGRFEQSYFEMHKMAIGLLYTQTGNVFSYYGNEIGMRNGLRGKISSDYTDYTYRTAMYWGDDAMYSSGGGFANKAYGYETNFGMYDSAMYDEHLGGVDVQMKDQNSIYNFYRRVMLLRRQNPEIAQGKSTFIATDNSDLLVLVREYKGSKILMIYNLNPESKIVYDASALISQYGLTGNIRGFLSSDNSRDVTMSGSKVTLPQFSMVVIK